MISIKGYRTRRRYCGISTGFDRTLSVAHDDTCGVVDVG